MAKLLCLLNQLAAEVPDASDPGLPTDCGDAADSKLDFLLTFC